MYKQNNVIISMMEIKFKMGKYINKIQKKNRQ